jgi:hypothetical protein
VPKTKITNSPNVAIKLCQYGNCFLLFSFRKLAILSFFLFFIKEGIIDRNIPILLIPNNKNGCRMNEPFDHLPKDYYHYYYYY